MNCASVRKLLVDYSEGALAGSKVPAVERHLSRCELCSRELSKIEELKESILSLGAPERDADFWLEFNRKLSQRLADTERGAADRRLLRRPGFTFAAGVATVLLIVWLTVMWLIAFPGSPERGETATLARKASRAGIIGLDDVQPELLLPYTYDDGANPALADMSGEEMEQFAEDMLLLIEESWQPASDEIVLDAIYEQSIYDMVEDLSAEEFEEVYESLESV